MRPKTLGTALAVKHVGHESVSVPPNATAPPPLNGAVVFTVWEPALGSHPAAKVPPAPASGTVFAADAVDTAKPVVRRLLDAPQVARYPLVTVPGPDTLPPPAGVPQVSVPSVLIFCRNCPPALQSFDCTPPSAPAAGVGSRAAPKVPLVMFAAFVASVVAEAASPDTSVAAGCD